MRYFNKFIRSLDHLSNDFSYIPTIKTEAQISFTVRIILKSEFKDKLGYCSVKVPKGLDMLSLFRFKEHCLNQLAIKSRGSLRMLEGDFRNSFIEPVYLVRRGNKHFGMTNILLENTYFE